MMCECCSSNEFYYKRYNLHVFTLKGFVKYLLFNGIFSRRKIYLCKVCGFGHVKTNQEILDNYYKKKYWDLRKRKKNDVLPSNQNDYKAQYQFDFISKYSNSIRNILEIGGGYSSFSRLYRSKHKKVELYVYEPSSAFDEFYKKNKITKIGIDDQIYDHIHLSHVLEHIYQPEKFIDSLKKNLSVNGTIYIEVPNCNQEYFKLNFIDTPHVNFFTNKSLKKMLNNCGLKIIDINTFGQNWGSFYDYKNQVHSFKKLPQSNFSLNENGITLRLIAKK